MSKQKVCKGSQAQGSLKANWLGYTTIDRYTYICTRNDGIYNPLDVLLYQFVISCKWVSKNLNKTMVIDCYNQHVF